MESALWIPILGNLVVALLTIGMNLYTTRHVSLRNSELLSKINTANQHALNLKAVEREALFDFNAKVSAWFYYAVRFSFPQYNFTNYKSLYDYFPESNRRQYEFDISYSHFRLFVRDVEVLETVSKLMQGIHEYDVCLVKTINDIYKIFSRAIEEAKVAPTEEFRTIKTNALSSVNERFTKYCEDCRELYRVAHGYHMDFVDKIVARIKQLEE